MTDATTSAAAQRAYIDRLPISDANRIELQSRTQSGYEAIDSLIKAHSIRLDILTTTIRAFKCAVENDRVATRQGGLLDTYYVVNLMEALEALVPDEKKLEDDVFEAIERADGDAAKPAASIPTPTPTATRSTAKRARREAIVGSAA